MVLPLEQDEKESAIIGNENVHGLLRAKEKGVFLPVVVDCGLTRVGQLPGATKKHVCNSTAVWFSTALH